MENTKKKRKAMKQPNGFGSVSKMSGRRRKPWRVRVTIGWSPEGKQLFKNIGTFETRKEALEALASWNMAPLTTAEKIKKEDKVAGLTFTDVYRMMYDYRESKGASADTLTSYRTAYKNLESIHGQIFTRIKKPQLQDAFDECTKSSSTKNKMKVLVNAMYKYAIEHELTDKDYSKMVDMDANKNENEHVPFSEEEIETIWTHADAGDEVAKIILLQIYTGTRINELLEIEKSNVHLVDQYCIGGKKTDNGKDRIIPLHDRIVPILAEFYDQDGPHLFRNSRGTRLKYNGFLIHFNKRMEEWKMEHSTHDARRTAATRLNSADVPYHIIKMILGHSTKSKDVTARYVSKDIAQLVKYVNKVR